MILSTIDMQVPRGPDLSCNIAEDGGSQMPGTAYYVSLSLAIPWLKFSVVRGTCADYGAPEPGRYTGDIGIYLTFFVARCIH